MTVLQLAELIGDAAFFPAKECSQGHRVEQNRAKVGDWCHECVHEEAEHRHSVPEWTAGEVDPEARNKRQEIYDEQDRECNKIRTAMEHDPALHPEWRIGRGSHRALAAGGQD